MSNAKKYFIMKRPLILLIFFILLSVLSCEKDGNRDISLEKVNGYVQKGPYLNGTAITIAELSDVLVPTGRNFSSQILDNKGTFEIRNIELSSQYVELRADGFYYDEVSDNNSASQLTLFALSDLSEKSTLNVNVLSSLEKGRVEFLVSEGMSFAKAKDQAQQEILSIFEINKEGMLNSESLDITKSGDDNAILLAISVILQGHQTVADLSEFLANFSTDFREDGELNSSNLGTVLINNARNVNPEQIRLNLENRYETLGLNVTIPEFEQYIAHFIDNTGFEFTAYIDYPPSGKYGLNILDKQKTEYVTGFHSMVANLPPGTNLKVKILGRTWGLTSDNTGWDHTVWDESDYSRFFMSNQTGEIDQLISLDIYQEDSIRSDTTRLLIFENGAADPTWTKLIKVIQ